MLLKECDTASLVQWSLFHYRQFTMPFLLVAMGTGSPNRSDLSKPRQIYFLKNVCMHIEIKILRRL